MSNEMWKMRETFEAFSEYLNFTCEILSTEDLLITYKLRHSAETICSGLRTPIFKIRSYKNLNNSLIVRTCTGAQCQAECKIKRNVLSQCFVGLEESCHSEKQDPRYPIGKLMFFDVPTVNVFRSVRANEIIELK